MGGVRNGIQCQTSDSPFASPTSSRHQLQPQGSSKRSGVPRDQPFPGVLQLKNLSREELVDVLREAVVDQKGEGWKDCCTGTRERSLPFLSQPSGVLARLSATALESNPFLFPTSSINCV